MWTAEMIARRAVAFDLDAPDDDGVLFEMPEDLSAVSDEELAALQDQAVEAFDALYDSDSEDGPSDDDVAQMQTLADALDEIRAAQTARAEARQSARERADELAARVQVEPAVEDDADVTAEVDEPAVEDVVEPELEPVTAGVRVRGVRRRQPEPQPEQERGTAIIAAAADVPGFAAGQEISTLQVGQAFAARTRGTSRESYKRAFDSGKRVRSQHQLAMVKKHFPAELIASSENAEAQMAAAVDERRLPGGSLVASGGWCAPSETIYDLFEMESRDGIFSLPEIQIARGGIRHTPGPDFSSIFGHTGYFNVTEDEAEAGDFDGYGGDKPFFKVDCPDFTDDRLNLAGVFLTAGILQDTAYPETIDRFVRGTLIAHEHKMAERVLGAIEGDSTVVTMPADPVGATAPILQAVEVQIEDYRARHRLARATSLEVVLPYWVRGAIRADLSRRLGVELTNVTDAAINEHFSVRGANVQFVYNWDDLTGPAADRLAFPTSVKALIYAAGTWVRGSSDVITLDAVYDSELFKANEYTAIFSEEGWLVAKRGHDSRVVTIPICTDGHTAGGVAVDCDGTEGDPILNG